MHYKLKYCVLCISIILMSQICSAHVIDFELEPMTDREVVSKFLQLGYTHILPLGLDHILFVICICFQSTRFITIIQQATLFTIAHCITLGLSTYQIVVVPAAIVEPFIALSITVLAIENLFRHKPHRWRWITIFFFGLIHGMGFAGALQELGLPAYAFTKALLSFNLGVELGQLSVVVVIFTLLIIPFRHRQIYRRVIVAPIAILIAITGLWWTIERL